MQEIEQLLRNNIGNRLTNELIIGLTAMITHALATQKQRATAPTRKPVAPTKGGVKDE